MAFPHTLRGTIGLAIAFSFILATFTNIQYTSPVTDTNKKIDTAMRQMVNSSNPISAALSSGNFILVFAAAIFDYVNIFYTVILGRVGGLPEEFAVVGLLLITFLIISLAFYIRGVFDV